MIKPRKIPMRTCIVTKEKYPKNELLRIVKFENVVSVDTTGKKNGKGCYVKKDPKVIEKARKTKAIDRALEVQVQEEIYDEILSLID